MSGSSASFCEKRCIISRGKKCPNTKEVGSKRKFFNVFAIALVILAGVFICPEESISAASIIIDQIMIDDCAEAKNEFIVLYNPNDSDVVLDGYKLTKKTKSGSESNLVSSSKFKGTVPAEGYFLISPENYKETIGADLAYSGSSYSISSDNTVLLYDRDGATIDKVGYGNAADPEKDAANEPSAGKSIKRNNHEDSDDNKKDFLLSLDLPKNSDDDEVPAAAIDRTCLEDGDGQTIDFSIKKNNEVYAGIYADFECRLKSAGQYKFTWNFGDNHKSYKQKTRHKYEKNGKYNASLKVYDKKKSLIKNFEVKVEDYSAPKIRIISLSPNPEGKDTDKEWIEIKNSSKRNINLKGWSIATGTEKLTNHPIRKDFKLKKNKSEKLKRKICAFSLGNTKTRIELRSPDGKVVDKLKYDRKKNKIEEDEIYRQDGKKWVWIKSLSEKEPTNAPKAKNDSARKENKSLPITSIDEEMEKINSEIRNNAGKITANPAWEEKKKKRIEILSFRSKIRTPESLTNSSQVLGTSAVRTHFKNFPVDKKKHWAIDILDNIWTKINLKINQVINTVW